MTVPSSVVEIDSSFHSLNTTHGKFDVILDIKQDTVVDSGVWSSDDDNGTGLIDICVRVDLLEPTLNYTSVNFHEVDVSLTIDMEQNFTIDESNIVDLTQINPLKDNRVAGISYNFETFQCDEIFAKARPKITQTSPIYICLKTNSTDVQFADVKNLVFSQGSLGLAAISNGVHTKNELTDVTGLHSPSVIIETKLLSVFFEEDDPEDVRVDGVVTMEFQDLNGNNNVAEDTTATPVHKLLTDRIREEFFSRTVSLSVDMCYTSNLT